MNRCKIILVDDHPILLEGTKTLLEQDPENDITAICHTGTEAVERLRTEKFDLALFDYEIPGYKGTELVKIALKANPDLKIIILSMHDEPVIVQEFVDLGVKGYVLKGEAHQELSEAVKAVKAHATYFSNGVLEILKKHEDQPAPQFLSPRELEIVKLIVKDYSTKQIADILFISIKTVETHRKNILRKTGCATSIGLVSYAHEHKIV